MCVSLATKPPTYYRSVETWKEGNRHNMYVYVYILLVCIYSNITSRVVELLRLTISGKGQHRGIFAKSSTRFIDSPRVVGELLA
jgi:hypothetical protein